MNADSIKQYEQAISGNFNDWHPPFMSILLFYVLKWGGSIGIVSLCQTVIACLGIYFFGREVLVIQNSKFLDNRINYCALLILLLLISPLSALPFYMMSFIKDAWLAITLIWVVYLFLFLHNKNRPITKIRFWSTVVALLSAMVISLLLRHNSLVLLPVYSFMLYQVSNLNNRKIYRNAFFNSKGAKIILFSSMALLPYFIYLIVSTLLYNNYNVAKTHPENQVIAMESLGSVVEQPDLKKQLTYLSSHLTEDYDEAYLPGNVAPVMPWGPFKAVDEKFDKTTVN